MTEREKSRLIKIMNLTRSDVPGEAAAAVWMANKVLHKHGLTWEKILECLETPTEDIILDVDELVVDMDAVDVAAAFRRIFKEDL